jgi:hypothetical protein
MISVPTIISGRPFVSVTCECGYKGRSQNPETYRCTACYNTDKAKACFKKIAELKAKIENLEKEAAEYAEIARKFHKRQEEKTRCKYRRMDTLEDFIIEDCYYPRPDPMTCDECLEKGLKPE